jgi:hypothetical protein
LDRNDRRSKTSFSYIRPPAAHGWANKRWCKDSENFWNGKEKGKENVKKVTEDSEKGEKIWKLRKYFVYLQRQNNSFDYPGRIPRGQDHIATAQLYKSHLVKEVAFICNKRT